MTDERKPDNWVVIKIPNNDGYKLVAHWLGSYTEFEKGEISEKIISAISQDDLYIFTDSNGIAYSCKKENECLTYYMAGLAVHASEETEILTVTMNDCIMNEVNRNQKKKGEFEMKLMPYFLVWNPPSGYTRKKHATLYDAEREAKRLALENKGSEFVVLAPVSSTKTADVVVDRFDYDHIDDKDIPF